MKRVLLPALLAALVAAGCGGDDEEATPTETATVNHIVEIPLRMSK